MIRNLLLICVIALIAIGCASEKTILLNPSAVPFDPVPWEEVHVYRSEADVPEEFIEIAIVSSKEEEVLTTEGQTALSVEVQMIKKMKEKAGKLGANAIVLQDDLGTKKISAIAIRVEEEAKEKM